MPRDLATLEKALWEQFEKATARQPKYEDNDSAYSSSSYPTNNAIEGRKSIALIADSLINLQREKREQDAANPNIRMPGK